MLVCQRVIPSFSWNTTLYDDTKRSKYVLFICGFIPCCVFSRCQFFSPEGGFQSCLLGMVWVGHATNSCVEKLRPRQTLFQISGGEKVQVKHVDQTHWYSGTFPYLIVCKLAWNMCTHSRQSNLMRIAYFSDVQYFGSPLQKFFHEVLLASPVSCIPFSFRFLPHPYFCCPSW